MNSDIIQELYNTIDLEGILKDYIYTVGSVYGLEEEVVARLEQDIDPMALWAVIFPEWIQRFSPEFTQQYLEHAEAMTEFTQVLQQLIQESVSVVIHKEFVH